MLCCFGAGLSAQAITGTITDSDGTPLIGASILVEGTTTGAVTDLDGNFSINAPANSENLIISYTGFQTQTVRLVPGQRAYTITLSEGVNLSEIVVSGQGVGLERKRLTTTVDVIGSEELELAPITQLDQLLQSRLQGTQIRLSSGQPGTASIIRNRGPLTANGSSTPVIIIDGVRVDNLNSRPALNVGTGGANSSALADIPVESIERVEFIRGGAATTLYGADAANGVLQIFTKKGTAGQARVNAGIVLGAMVGEREFLRFEQTGDLLFETGLVQQYRFGVDGGNDKVTYNFSGSFYDDDGFNDINEQRRINARFGTRAIISDKLTYSGTAAFTSNFFTRDYNANTSFSRFGGIEGGNFGIIDTLGSDRLDEIRMQLRREAEATDITDAIRRWSTSQQLEYKPFQGFTGRLIVGLDNRRNRNDEIASNELLIAKGSRAPGTTDQGSFTRATRDFLSLTGDLAAGYEFDAGSNFSFNTTAGAQVFREQDEQLLLSGTNLVEGSRIINNTADQTVSEFFEAITFGGFYLAENIGFKDKLFFDFGTRWDFNSAFGDDIGLINLLRFGLRYSLTDEPFMINSSLSNIFTRVSFRANYGEASNFPTPFARDRLFAANPFLGSPSYTFGNPGNPDLRPEVVKSYEVGGDFSFVNGRIGLGVTYYDQTTEDAIFSAPSAPSVGQLNQEANVGEISNKGFEFGLDLGIVQTQDVDFSVNASLTTNTNEVVSAGGSPEFSVGGFSFLGSFVREGQPLGYFRGANPTVNADGEFSVERNAVLGNPTPDGYGTIGFNFRFKRFTAFASADYQYGAQGIAVDDVLRFFDGISDEGRIPDAALEQAGSFFDLAGYWVEDTDFLKVRNIGLSYNVNTTNLPFKSLRVGFNMRNPLVFAQSSFDPEITGSGIAAQGGFAAGGFGYGTESAPEQYLFTLDFSF